MTPIRISPGVLEEAGASAVTPADLLSVIEQNRVRLRTLSGMVLNVCGMLLSAAFVILFFLLKDAREAASVSVIGPLAAALGCLIAAVVFSILAGFVPAPVAVTTRVQLLDILATRCRREHRCAKIAVSLLFAAMILVAVALVALSTKTLRQPANKALRPTAATATPERQRWAAQGVATTTASVAIRSS